MDESKKFCKQKFSNIVTKCSIIIEYQIEGKLINNSILDILGNLEKNISIKDIKDLEETIKENECDPLREDLAKRLSMLTGNLLNFVLI